MKATQKPADERLLIEAAQKDPGCFGELYERNFERVYAFVARRVSSREEAQDITAEVFHDALANIGRFEWCGLPFAAWLYRIAANAIADRWQRSGREPQSSADDPADTSATSGYTSLDEIERRASLFRLVATLPQEQRRVIHERFVEQKSIREIAKGLRKTEGAVKQLQFRALRACARVWVANMAKQSLGDRLDKAIHALLARPGAPLPREAELAALVRLPPICRICPAKNSKLG